MAWTLSVVLALTPTTRALADAFGDAASQGQSFGRAQVPSPTKLFGTDEGGNYEIFPDSDNPVTITPHELFGSGPGSISDLKGLRGDNDAIRQKTLSTRENLATNPSEYGQAYRLLTGSTQRAHPDLSNDPIWDTSHEVMGDLFNGEYSACDATREVVPDAFTTHLPDYRTCNRMGPTGKTCAIKHDYQAGVIEHVDGPLNIQSCGRGCSTIWIGRQGDNYWDHESYVIHNQSIKVRVINPSAITHVSLDEAWWDDHMQIWINGVEVWWSSTKDFPPDHASCNVDQFAHGYPGTDLTSYFKNVAPGSIVTIETRVLVCDRGEGYARLKMEFDPDKTITGDTWEAADDCQETIDAINSGFASGEYACTNKPGATNGCLSIGGSTICETALSQPPAPVQGISPLCREVAVNANIDFNKGQMECWTDPQGNQHCPMNTGDTPDTCAALEANPSCRFLSSECVEGASDERGHCYAYTVRYDCGEEVSIPTANVKSTYTCPGEIRCMGNECITSTTESNKDFARAVGAIQAADYMAMDMTCPEGDRNNIDVDTCDVFIGEASKCKIAVGGSVDCCEKPQDGVSLGGYISMMNAGRKVASLVTGEGGALHGTWMQLTQPVTDAWSSVSSYFGSSLDANTASTGLRIIGLEELKQQAMKKAAQFMVDNFGQTAASMFFTSSGEASLAAGGGLAVTDGAVQGTVQLTAALGTALSVVMWAYTAYTVAMLLIKVIWACEKSELQLGVKRKLKSAHYLGSYCASKVLGACIEKRQSYCTFNSPLSRIIQEQIRAQLGISWGSKKHPNCRGLTVAEINEADWDKINLDEWIAILQTTGHMPSSPADAISSYSLDELTKNTDTLDIPGAPGDDERQNTLKRNQQRLDQDGTLDRNEDLRQALWGSNGDQGMNQGAPPVPPSRPSPCISGTKVFNYTGAMQSFTVPNKCYRLDVRVEGASSGAANTITGNSGQVITDRLSVLPGNTLPIKVGRGGGVVSYWDTQHRSPGYYGQAGQGAAIYNTANEPWVVANGGGQTGATSARPSQAWVGRNARVVIQWGSSPSDPPAPPDPTPLTPPAPAPNPCAAGMRVFNYTGHLETFFVPSACTLLSVQVEGADSGSASNIAANQGQHKSGDMPVSPGEKINVLVGHGGKVEYDNGWVGRVGGASTIYTSDMQPWVSAAGGGQTGRTQAQPSSAWTGRNGRVVLRWGLNPPALPSAPQRQPQSVPPPPCRSGSRYFYYTGAMQSFTVPANCSHLDVIVDGASGAGGNHGSSFAGGAGARVSGTIQVSPNATIQVLVGGGGRSSLLLEQTLYTTAYYLAGGGGGRSAILTSGGVPIAVAGGGGGAYNNKAGNGGFDGEDVPNSGGSLGARGGTQTHGGAGGSVDDHHAQAGSRGQGGDAFAEGSWAFSVEQSSGRAYGGGGMAIYGGGGGGGFYGGGGGIGFSGAGGSSYTGGLDGANVIDGGGSQGRDGLPGKHGQVVIHWNP